MFIFVKCVHSFCRSRLFLCIRGAFPRKVRSIVFYLNNQFTNHIMLGIILKSYLSFMLYHEKYYCEYIHVLFVYWKTQNFS